ncbi:hypothetical protein Clacol_004155 [Clathrus columnatus]|uniref:Uncharacterized protein n=1 Tax=Clathrus columnatus TaxID=1419009 RepID=A0AAV5A5K8_9AGAM|nr:hypothetical protein Clacol_004155 [Clathrus columnatus]
MLAGPSGGNGSTERVESVAQSVTPNHTIQLKLTTDNPDKPISRKITYDALPAWRHLCSKIEKLFGINFDAIQVIYPLENEIIVKGDHDLHAVLGSAPIAEHIFKFIVRNMHSPKTGSKIIGRPTHNRLTTPKKFHMDMLRALDTDIPPLNEPPPNIMNHKPKKYRLFPLNGVYNEDYLRKRADRYNSVPLGVPLETPRITSNIDWPKEIPERITGPKSQPPGPSAITAGPKPTNEVGQRPVQTQTQPVRSMPAPALEPVQGLALDLGPPASGFIQPASTLEEPSEVHVTFNNNNNNTPRPSSSILHAFPIPVSPSNIVETNPLKSLILKPPRIIPPPPSQSSIPELVPASMFPIIRVDNTETNRYANVKDSHKYLPKHIYSLGFGFNLPLGMMHPNSTMLLSPQQQPTKQRHSGASDRSISNTIKDPQDSGIKPRLSPPPGFIPTGRSAPQPRPSPMGRIIDDTSDFTNPIMLLSPLLLPGEDQVPQNNSNNNNNRADNNRLRRRPGEIVVIEDTSASSPNSIGGGGSAGGLESLLRNASGGSASASISPPLGSAAIQRYLDADSDCSSEQVQRPKARIHTPPISSSRTRSRHPDPMLKMKSKTSSRRRTTKTMRTPSPEPCSESSSSSPPPSIKILSEKKKKSPNTNINSIRSGEATASIISTFQLSPDTTTSKPKSSSAPAPARPLEPIPPSSISTNQINSLSDHAAGPIQSTASSETLPIPSKTTPYDPKIEITDVIRVQVKELIREVIEELKNEMQRTMTEMFRVHCNEIREQLTQADRQSTERSRGDSQERPTYAASTTHPHHPHAPPPPSSHFPPAPSGSIPQSHPSLSVPPPISYHPYMSLPTSTLIFPPHHPYCGDYTLPTPTFSIPYRSYVIPSITGLPSYHPGACCHIHHAIKPGDIPMESSYYHHPPPPPPPPPLAHHVPPPPLSSGPQHPYFYGRGRWFTPDTQTPGMMGAGVGVGAAPAYSGNNNENSSLPQQPGDVDRMRNEYSEGLARLRNIEERFNALLDGPENGKPCAEKREVSTLTSVQTNSEQSRTESANVPVSLDASGGSHQRSAWESLMSYVSKPGFGLAWPRIASMSADEAVESSSQASSSSAVNSTANSVKAFIAGGFGGVAAVLVGHPFDLTKTRLQTANTGVYTGALDVVKKTVARDGLTGLYRGVVPPLLGVTPIFAISFWAYDFSKNLIFAFTPNRTSTSLSIGELATAGFLSAVPTTLVTAPVERAKVLLQVQGQGGEKKYKGVFDVFKVLYKEGGIKSIFRGSGATIARDGPGSAAYFAAYEVAKKALTPKGSDPSRLNLGTIIMAGGTAGVAMWSIAIPPDVLKSRIQAAPTGTYSGLLDCARKTIAADGVRALWKGFGPAMARAFPANAATFVGVEASRKVLDSMF